MSVGGGFSVESLAATDDMAAVRELFREYQRELGVDLGFQDFDAELAGLPGAYAPPRGRLLLARQAGEAAGCVAMRPLAADQCEMKRLYVRPAFRAARLGLLLAERLISEAGALGYRRMCLDTLPSMARAQRLYESLGFRDIAPYRPNPVPGALYLELAL
jgi:ribosomal protein S18 acetylase RimI-like enzyme